MKTSRFISLLLCVVMIMSLFTGLAGSASADDVITHEVQSGEILMKICEKYGLNYYNCKNAIMQLNGFTNENQLAKLTVGQKLKLPASNTVAGTVSTTTATVTTTTVGGTTLTTTSYGVGGVAGGSAAFYLTPYTVKAGDTLNKICNELGSNYYYYAPVIQGINALANPNQIHAGQVLLIPTASAAGATSAVVGHVVQAGETMSSIANQYGINYQAQRQLINGLNRRDNMDKIYVGQTVLLPGAAAAATAVATTTTTTSAGTAAAATSAATSGNYQISISGATNGSPYAVVNNTQYATRANAGETVNIVPSPKAGYAVRDIQVVRSDSGTDIPISNYSFTMPNSSVQVTVFYSRGYVINKVASPYGTFDTTIYGTNANTAFYGDEVTLAFYPKKGYNVAFPDKSKNITGVYYQKSDLSMERVYVWPDDSDGLYRFKMPNYEIRLTVDFVISKYFSLQSSVPSGGGSVVFTVDGVQTKRVMEGQTVTMQMVPAAGWTFDSDTYEKSTGFTVLGNNVSNLTKVNSTTYRFVMGSVGVSSGDVTFINHNTYALIPEIRGGDGSLVFQIVDGSFNVVRQNVSRAEPGQLVEVIAHPHNGWAFTETGDDSSSKYMLNMSMGKASHCQVNGGSWTSMSGRYIFKMPAEDVGIVTKFIRDKTKAYYEFRIEYDSNHGIATAFQDGKPVVNHALAGKPVEIKVSAYNNYRATGVLWFYTGNTAGTWIGSRGDTQNKTWNASFTKNTSLDTVRIFFEEFTDYTTIGKNEYKIDTRTGADDPDRAKISMSGIVQNANFKVGDTISFTATSGFGYTVSEVWLKRDGAFVKMLAPTTEGGNAYSYTVTAADKGKTINFLAVRKGTEPRHYIIPEYTIADTGITNVNGEVLYTVKFKKTGSPAISEDIGPVYGMGATKLVVEDRFIKADEGVWVEVSIPKKIHTYEGVGTTLYYQVDTLTVRFSDYVLDNYKILDDGTDVFTYAFWYNTDDPITDLNIMVNYKEVGTDANKITQKTTTVTIDGQKVVVTETSPGKYEGKITIGGTTSTVKVEVS